MIGKTTTVQSHKESKVQRKGKTSSNKSFLVRSVLASTLFAAFHPLAFATVNLDAGANGQTSATAPYFPGTGYNFTASNVTFFITPGTIIGNTGGVSIDNTGNNIFDAIFFQGAGTVTGTISPTFGILGIGLTGTTSDTVYFQADLVQATPVVFFTDTMLKVANGVNINVNTGAGLDSANGTAGTLIFEGASTVTGNVGQSNPLKLISVNTLGGNNTLTLASAVVQANTINVVGVGGTTIKLDSPGGALVNANFTTNNNNVDILDINNAGNTTLNGNIGSQTHFFNAVNLSSATTTTINGDIFANNIEFQALGTLQLTSGSVAYGPITTAVANNTGTVQFLGNSDILFPIGDPGNAINLVNIHGAAGTNVNLIADIVANTMTVDNGGTLTVVDTPTVTANNVTISNGTLFLTNQSQLNIVGPFTMNTANTNIAVDMAGNLRSTGDVVASGAATVAPPTTLTVLRPGFSPGIATVIPVVTGGAGSALAVIPVTNQDTFLTNFETKINPGNPNELDLVITSQPLTSVATPPNQGVAGALDSIALGGATFDALEDLIEELSLFTDADSLNYALSTLAPIVDGAIVYEGFMNQKQIFGSLNDRMQRVNFWRIHLNMPKMQSGQSSGDLDDRDYGGWVKVFRQHANQKRRQGVDGYRNDSWGVILGGDTMLTDNSLIGWSLSWSTLDVHDNVSLSKTLANSYQGTVYSTIDFDCPFFFNLAVGAAYNNYLINRNIFFGRINSYPRARFHGIQTGAIAEAGYVYGMKMLHAIPFASLYYSNLNLRAYEEKRSQAANQMVDGADYNMLQAGLGLRLIDDYVINEKMLFQGEFHLQALYDFIGDRMQTTSQFVGAGPSFITPGFSPVQDSYNIGLSGTIYGINAVIFTANYDFDYKKDYTSHAGYLRARYEW